MQMSASEVDLIPLKVNRLTNPQSMPSHYQQERCISLPIPAFTSCADELG
jgi:hypothetical protein